MKPITKDDINFSYYRPESNEHLPIDIYFKGESISRGRITEVEGSEGIVYDMQGHNDYGSYEFTITVYWFSGPLSADKAKRSQTYDLKGFLVFLGWELVEE